MPGLAKCGRRADTSGVRPPDDFRDLDVEVREDPEIRRGCNWCFPGSSKETGTGIIQERGVDVERRSEGEEKRKRGHGCVLENRRGLPPARKWSTRGKSHAAPRRNT